MKNKRGSHVGMILSFVIFLVFVIFVYSIIQPAFQSTKGNEQLLDYLRAELLKRFDSEITTMTINIPNININKDCISVTNIVQEMVKLNFDLAKLMVKNQQNDILTYKTSQQTLYIKVGIGYKGIVKLFFSRDISNSNCNLIPGCTISGCQPITGVNVEAIKIENTTAVKNLDSLITRYETDYENLKIELKIPAGTEFTFAFRKQDGTILEPTTGNVPETGDVFVQEFPVLYFDENANLEYGFLIITIW